MVTSRIVLDEINNFRYRSSIRILGKAQ